MMVLNDDCEKYVGQWIWCWRQGSIIVATKAWDDRKVNVCKVKMVKTTYLWDVSGGSRCV